MATARGPSTVKVLAVVLAGLSGALRAQSERDLDGLHFEVAAPWPATVDSGFVPVFVAIENGSGAACDVAVSAQRDAGGGCLARLAIGAGERRRVELLVPAFRDNSSADLDVVAQVDSSGAPAAVRFDDVGEAPQPGIAHPRPALWLAPEARPVPQPSQLAAFGLGALIQLAPIRFDAAATDFRAYLGVPLVIVDARAGLPPSDRLAALLAYARLGGVLAIFGRSGSQLRAADPSLAAWIEPRFALLGGAEGRCYTFGFGRLVALPDAPRAPLWERDTAPGLLEWEDQARLIRGALEQKTTFLPSGEAFRPAFAAPIPGIDERPVGAIALALLFAAGLLGPGAWLAAKRLRRPASILALVPAIALLGSAAIVAAGGRSRTGMLRGSSALTILECRTHVATTCESRTAYAGSPAAAPLASSARTALLADVSPPTDEDFHVELDRAATRYGAGYLPAARAIEQMLLSDGVTDLRLAVVAKEGGYAVESGLPARVLELFFRAPDGSEYRLSSALEPRGSAKLVPAGPMIVDAAALRACFERPLVRVAQATEEGSRDVRQEPIFGLPRGCFVAMLDRSPFADDCGVDWDDAAIAHRLIGIGDGP